jgi:prepilin-type N-terminal cleavage/methylation domain-containing protein
MPVSCSISATHGATSKAVNRGATVRACAVSSGGRRAFTLLEVMVSVAVIGLIAVALHRFVGSQMVALRVSEEVSQERQALAGVVHLLQEQLESLPAPGQTVVLGQPHKFRGHSSDVFEWSAFAGSGLMTTAATGEYRVSLELKPTAKTSSILELGLRRRPVNGNQKDETWVPLLSPVSALEIRYFNPLLNAKVDRWNDGSSLPALVYLSIQRRPDELPHEALLGVPASRIQR